MQRDGYSGPLQRLAQFCNVASQGRSSDLLDLQGCKPVTVSYAVCYGCAGRGLLMQVPGKRGGAEECLCRVWTGPDVGAST